MVKVWTCPSLPRGRILEIQEEPRRPEALEAFPVTVAHEDPRKMAKGVVAEGGTDGQTTRERAGSRKRRRRRSRIPRGKGEGATQRRAWLP